MTNFMIFAALLGFGVVVLAGVIIISKFAGSIQNLQADTEKSWDAADKLGAAREQEVKNRAAGGK